MLAVFYTLKGRGPFIGIRLQEKIYIYFQKELVEIKPIACNNTTWILDITAGTV